MDILVIVESPSKCKRIKDILGQNYNVIASFGHLTELSSLEDINMKTFETFQRPIKSKSRQRVKIKQAIQRSSKIIIATDNDREGEAIGYHICNLYGLPIESTERIIFNEITHTAINNAILNPTLLNINKINSAITRQIIDLLIGFNISPILCETFNKKLSAGRCQTPALKITYENQLEINKTKNNLLYKTVGLFTDLNISFELNHKFNIEDKQEIIKFLELSKNYHYQFQNVKTYESIENTPKPLTTSTLQQISSNLYNFEPKLTMDIAQSLYENGHITYMRTDSTGYSLEFIQNISVFLNKKYGKEFCNQNIPSTKGAHESIRPTYIIENPTLNNDKEMKIYKLIYNHTLQCCMTPYIQLNMDIEISAPCEYIYKHTVHKPKFLGWKIVNENKKQNLLNLSTYNFIQNLKQLQLINYNKIKLSVINSNIPLHMTEARLISLLENKGIGRPSTYSSLIEKIKQRKYVTKTDISGEDIEVTEFILENNLIKPEKSMKTFNKEKNKLVITPLGISVINFLEQYDKLFNYEYTNQMENNLDLISNGRVTLQDICRDYLKQIDNVLSQQTLDNKNKLITHGNSVVLKKNDGTSFQVDSNITLENVQDKSIRQIIKKDELIGIFENEKMYIKQGKYGEYVEWGKNKKSLKQFKGEKKYENIIEFIFNKQENINLTQNADIRNGKYGPYIYYKTKIMKKPKFYGLDNFDYKNKSVAEILDWVYKTHKVKL